MFRSSGRCSPATRRRPAARTRRSPPTRPGLTCSAARRRLTANRQPSRSDQGRQDAPGGHGRPARRATPTPTAGTTTPSAVEFHGSDLTSGDRLLHRDHVRRPRQRRRRSVQGTCIDNAGNVSAPLQLRAQVRRDRANRDRGADRSAAGPRRLVHRSRAARRRGDRRDLRPRGMPDRHLRRPDSASVSVIGTCRDDAGNAASRTFALSFDATPPHSHEAVGVGRRSPGHAALGCQRRRRSGRDRALARTRRSAHECRVPRRGRRIRRQPGRQWQPLRV